MLNLKKDNSPEKIYVENFVSAIPGEQMELICGYEDPFTEREITITTRIPRLKNLDTEQTILLLEELRCHLKYHIVGDRRPKVSYDTEQDRIRMEQRKYMIYLINQVQKSLKERLVEAVGTEYLITADFLFRQGNERLYDPETMLIHMYANDCVPDETGFYATDILGEYLEKKLKKLEYQLEHLTEDVPTAASVSPRELLKFRCKVVRDQLAMIEAVDRANVMQDAGEVQPEDLCVQGKTIESKYPPQWYRLPELIGHIEQMRFWRVSGEVYANLDEKYDVWLEELNHRIEGMLPGCASPNQEAEEERERRNFRFPNSYLHGALLERAEDMIACWYLNDCFPYGMDLEQMHRVERALKRQLDALDDEEADCRERGELALWQLRCQLWEEQLNQIQEEIALTEYLVPTEMLLSDVRKDLN